MPTPLSARTCSSHSLLLRACASASVCTSMQGIPTHFEWLSGVSLCSKQHYNSGKQIIFDLEQIIDFRIQEFFKVPVVRQDGGGVGSHLRIVIPLHPFQLSVGFGKDVILPGGELELRGLTVVKSVHVDQVKIDTCQHIRP